MAGACHRPDPPQGTGRSFVTGEAVQDRAGPPSRGGADVQHAAGPACEADSNTTKHQHACGRSRSDSDRCTARGSAAAPPLPRRSLLELCPARLRRASHRRRGQRGAKTTGGSADRGGRMGEAVRHFCRRSGRAPAASRHRPRSGAHSRCTCIRAAEYTHGARLDRDGARSELRAPSSVGAASARECCADPCHRLIGPSYRGSSSTTVHAGLLSFNSPSWSTAVAHAANGTAKATSEPAARSTSAGSAFGAKFDRAESVFRDFFGRLAARGPAGSATPLGRKGRGGRAGTERRAGLFARRSDRRLFGRR